MASSIGCGGEVSFGDESSDMTMAMPTTSDFGTRDLGVVMPSLDMGVMRDLSSPSPPDMHGVPDLPVSMDMSWMMPEDMNVMTLCTGRADGTHCGSALGTDPPNTLYTCRAGQIVSQEVCPVACGERVEPEQDLCVDDTIEPCFNDPDGTYCGHAIGASTERESLYRCEGLRTVSTSACPTWCHGQEGDDVCANNLIDACFDDADGDYCGGYIGASSRQGDVFTCRGQRTAQVTSCAHGCDQGRCVSAPSACLSRPPGTFTRGFNACGGGGYHHGIDLGSPLNTPIPAGMSGEVVSVREGQPNCPYNASTGTCPSSCINNFNYVKIRVDGGDPRRAGHDLYLYYLHVDHLASGIGSGSRIAVGQTIAYVGNSGCSSGPHIHLETVSVPAGQAAYLNTCNSFDPSTIYCP